MPEALQPFQKKQFEFTRFIRDPEHNIPPRDIEKRRIDMYRELVFNNVEDVLSSNFPVLRKITPDDLWQSMASDFLAQHKCQSPYFLDIPEEFLEYLQNERQVNEADPPFLLELAHYEWIESVLVHSHDNPPDKDPIFEEGPLDYVAKVSDVAWVLSYRFPVQKISPKFIPELPSEQPNFLAVYRDLNDDVKFLELNAITNRLLQLIQKTKDRTTRYLLETIASELRHPNPDVVISGGKEILNDLAKQSVIYRQN